MVWIFKKVFISWDFPFKRSGKWEGKVLRREEERNYFVGLFRLSLHAQALPVYLWVHSFQSASYNFPKLPLFGTPDARLYLLCNSAPGAHRHLVHLQSAITLILFLFKYTCCNLHLIHVWTSAPNRLVCFITLHLANISNCFISAPAIIFACPLSAPLQLQLCPGQLLDLPLTLHFTHNAPAIAHSLLTPRLLWLCTSARTLALPLLHLCLP